MRSNINSPLFISPAVQLLNPRVAFCSITKYTINCQNTAMAKARASATPAKGSRKASPAKSKAASPAPATRSSPRRAAPSAKAQEATDDRVQTGRVTKKTSPSKAATPAKKASPAKAATKKASPAKAKAASPAKEKQSPTKPSLASPKKAGEKKVPTHPDQDPAEAKHFLKTPG